MSNKKYGNPDNAEMLYKCSQCGNMFEPKNQTATNCPICGNSCTPDSCTLVGSSNEDY